MGTLASGAWARTNAFYAGCVKESASRASFGFSPAATKSLTAAQDGIVLRQLKQACER
jgi:hypothetical protein